MPSYRASEMLGAELMSVYRDLLIGKLGADGCYGIGIRESEYTKRLGMSTSGIGIAVKIEDGNINILYAAVMEILVQLGIGTEEVRNKLRSWHTPSVFNTMGIVTGVTSHSYIVRRHSVVVRGERDEGEERAALASFT
jgi:L-asparaginase II